MHQNKEVAENVAKSLLQIKAVKLSPNNPFTWASGWKSPIYCDNRLTLSYPQIRTFLRQEFVKTISEEVGHIDIVVGVATKNADTTPDTLDTTAHYYSGTVKVASLSINTGNAGELSTYSASLTGTGQLSFTTPA